MTPGEDHRDEASPVHVLLTGATGLLGRYLLKDLLLTGLKVAVLARARGPRSAADRIGAILRDWEAEGIRLDPPRILEGSLDLDDLGEAASHDSWPRIEAVVHAAASVAFVQDPQTGEPRRSNVEGTRRLLRWCGDRGVRFFHYVSSAYACGLAEGPVPESEIDPSRRFRNVYEESKAEAEALVRKAGLRFSIYRPSIIVGPSSGAPFSSHAAPVGGVRAFQQGLAILEQLRATGQATVPEDVLRQFGFDGAATKNLVPVDWVSAAIVRLMERRTASGETYHLTSPAPVRVVEILRSLSALASNSEAPARVVSAALAEEARAAFRVSFGPYATSDPAFDRAHTERDLEDLPCPQVGEAQIAGGLAALPGSGSLLPEPLAVVGMAVRLPGADDLDAYWNLILEGRTAIGPLPESRLDREAYFDSRKGRIGRTYSDIGGLVDEAPPSAELAARLGPELEAADACHRILADVALEAARDSGLDFDSPGAQRAGVYVGHSGGSPKGGDSVVPAFAETLTRLLRQTREFGSLKDSVRTSAAESFTAAVKSWGETPQKGAVTRRFEAHEAARLVARTLRLDGPKIVVDAACASSLAALGLASLALGSGEIDTAIVAGASMASAQSLVLFSRARSCSAAGSRPFDDEADGLVASEGYVVLVLKTLEKARRDGDRIRAVIRGLGMSSDGRARSLWAPRREGQVQALRRAYSGLDPKRIDYLEAHATSTQVGDATEIESLGEFFGPHLGGRRVPLGSVKSNFGHTLETAGLASLVKTVLILEKGMAPPVASLVTLNRSVPWSSLPFDVPRAAAPLRKREGAPLCAGVSAFGIGGLNVHAVVEAPDPASSEVPRRPGRTAAGRTPIAILGRGVVNAGAASLLGFARFLEAGRPGLGAPPASDPRTLGQVADLGGYIRDYRFDWRRRMIPPKQLKRGNPLRFMLFDAVEQAIGEGRFLSRERDRAGCAVVAGLHFASDFGNDLQLGLRLPELALELDRRLEQASATHEERREVVRAFERAVLQRKRALLDETGGFTNSSLASGIAKLFDVMGGALALDAGEACGEAALETARKLLEARTATSVICVAGRQTMDAFHYGLLRERGLVPPPPGQAWPGEGVAALILKRLDDAERDGDLVLGRLDEAGTESRTRIAALIGDAGPATDLTAVIASTLESGMGARVEATVEAPGRGAREPRLVRFGAPDEASLRRLLSEAPPVADRLFHAPSSFAAADAWRAVLGAHSPAELAARAHELARAPWPGGVQGAVVREVPKTPPRIAFAFPGQGAHHPQMFASLLHSPSARRVLEQADRAARAMDLDSFEAMTRGERLDRDPIAAQLSVLVANVMAKEALREMGVRPDSVHGHSFGELAALEAAGVWSLEQALHVAFIRAEAIARSPRGRLLALARSERETRALIAECALPVHVTHMNAPDQTVVGGDLELMDRFEARLAARGIRGVPLGVAGALHTPLMSGARAILAAALLNERLAPPTTLLMTSAHNRYASEPAEIREALANQLTEPLHYVELVRRLEADGAGVFIEAGPRSVLTRLHGRILGEGSVSLATAEPSRAFGSPWLRIQAELETLGLRSATGTAAGPAVRAGAAIIEYDATSNRRAHRLEKAARPSSSSSSRLPAGGGEPDATGFGAEDGSPELIGVLLDFVVEHTGYPRNVIRPDWDLEADLGIDSIKRAQLFGEVANLLNLDEAAGRELLKARTLRAVLQSASGLVAETPRDRGVGTSPPPLPAPKSTLTSRYVLGLADAPQRPGVPTRPRLAGVSVILGSNPVARALKAEIEELEHQAVILPATGDIDALLKTFDDLWAGAPAPHLFIATPRDEAAATRFDPRHWQERRSAGVDAPFELCRRFLAHVAEAGLAHLATLTGILSAGGSFGVENPVPSAESGAISGLIKAIGIENWVSGARSLRTLVIDAPEADDPLVIARAVLAELAVPSYDVEVAWSRGHRRRLLALATGTPSQGSSLGIRRGSVWVCTGGARGVTRRIAEELAAESGAHLHLIGLSPEPALGDGLRLRAKEDPRALRVEVMGAARARGENPVEAWQATEKAIEIADSLEEMAGRGIRARYHACDVGDRAALARVLARIRETDGPIEGILHGAAFSRDARLQDKKPEHVSRCLRSKVDGAFFLMDLTREDPLRHFIGMGSISGRFGANGQSDYSLANDMLTKLVSWFRHQRPEVLSTTFDWHAWDDAGMATRGETRLALEAIGLRFMKAGEGVAHAINEIRAGLPRAEVLITDDRYARMFGLGDTLADTASAAGGPALLEGALMQTTADGFKARVVLDPGVEPFLREHRFDGSPLLPFAVGIELLCESALLLSGQPPATLRELRAQQALWFPGGRSRTVDLEARPAETGGLRCSLSAEVAGPDGRVIDERRGYVTGRVEPASPEAAAPRAPRPDLAASWTRVDYAAASTEFHLGPPFQTLRRFALEGDSAFAEAIAPDASELGGIDRRSRRYLLPCALLDACFQVVARFAAARVQDSDSFPFAIDALRLGRMPDRGEACLVEAVLREAESGDPRFDFRAWGADGALLLDATGYRVAWRPHLAQARTRA